MTMTAFLGSKGLALGAAAAVRAAGVEDEEEPWDAARAPITTRARTATPPMRYSWGRPPVAEAALAAVTVIESAAEETVVETESTAEASSTGAGTGAGAAETAFETDSVAETTASAALAGAAGAAAVESEAALRISSSICWKSLEGVGVARGATESLLAALLEG